MVVECNTILMWNWGSIGLVLALSLLMDASTSLPGTGRKQLPHSPPASLRSREGDQNLLLLLHWVPSHCPPPCPALAGSSLWLCPSHHGQPGSGNTGVLSFLSPVPVCASADCKSCHLVCDMGIDHHNTWSCHKGHADTDKRIHKYESPYTAVQVCLVGLDLAKSLLLPQPSQEQKQGRISSGLDRLGEN